MTSSCYQNESFVNVETWLCKHLQSKLFETPRWIIMLTLWSYTFVAGKDLLVQFCDAKVHTRKSNRKILLKRSRNYDEAIKWKHCPRYWPFVRGINPSPVVSPHKGSVNWNFDIFFDLYLNKRLSEQSIRWWCETPSRPLWSQSNVIQMLNWCMVDLYILHLYVYHTDDYSLLLLTHHENC